MGIANDLTVKLRFPVIAVPLGSKPEDTPVERKQGG